MLQQIIEEVRPLLLPHHPLKYFHSQINPSKQKKPNSFSTKDYYSITNKQQSRMASSIKERFYSSYIQLGIASYTLENWCTSVASFERARRISEIHNFTFPNNFDSAIEYAKSQMELVK